MVTGAPGTVIVCAPMEASHLIGVAEHTRRREAVLQALGGAAAVVLAGRETSSVSPVDRWKTDRLFWYLTGLDYEGGAAVLFDPAAEDPERRITLFLRPRDPEMETLGRLPRCSGPRPQGQDGVYKHRTDPFPSRQAH